MGIGGALAGIHWALDVNGSVWLGIGKWAAIACEHSVVVGCGFFVSVRRITGLVETWKDRVFRNGQTERGKDELVSNYLRLGDTRW